MISTNLETQVFLSGKDAKISPVDNKIIAQISSVAEINGDGKLDLIGIDADGKPTVFQNNSAKNYHWQILQPKAAKTEGDQRVNSFGIGGEMEIRSGTFGAETIDKFAAGAFRFGRKSNGGCFARRLGKRLCAGGI